MARKGGIAAHKYPGGTWEWTKAEAAEAGRKGGLETWRRRRAAKAAAEQKTEGVA
jgi:general stress protein YciG